MKHHRHLKFYLFLITLCFFAFDNRLISILAFVEINVILGILAMNTAEKRRQIAFILVCYGLLMGIQVCFAFYILGTENISILDFLWKILMTLLLLLLSFTMEYYLQLKQYRNYYFNSTHDAEFISFDALFRIGHFVQEKKGVLSKATAIITRENVQEILSELKRNNSFSYINDGNLSEDYFQLAEATLEEPYLYFVLSSTGSVTSRLISLVTESSYNHASLSFDRGLKTLVSYNGGEQVRTPGLNIETLDFLMAKKGAVLYIYKIEVTLEQKRVMLEKIKEINREGSAYNLLGLVLKKSYKPNIMYCSQFVYTLFEYAGITYFQKDPNRVNPTDFIELDYHRKLQFEYEIKFN